MPRTYQIGARTHCLVRYKQWLWSLGVTKELNAHTSPFAVVHGFLLPNSIHITLRTAKNWPLN